MAICLHSATHKGQIRRRKSALLRAASPCSPEVDRSDGSCGGNSSAVAWFIPCCGCPCSFVALRLRRGSSNADGVRQAAAWLRWLLEASLCSGGGAGLAASTAHSAVLHFPPSPGNLKLATRPCHLQPLSLATACSPLGACAAVARKRCCARRGPKDSCARPPASLQRAERVGRSRTGWSGRHPLLGPLRAHTGAVFLCTPASALALHPHPAWRLPPAPTSAVHSTPSPCCPAVPLLTCPPVCLAARVTWVPRRTREPQSSSRIAPRPQSLARAAISTLSRAQMVWSALVHTRCRASLAVVAAEVRPPPQQRICTTPQRRLERQS